jgi:cell division transport system permease protein
MARSAWMSWLVVVTIAVSLSILGGFWLISQDLQLVARQVGSNVPIVVFLTDEANPRGVEELLRQVPGIRDIKLITKEQAWREMQEDMRSRMTFDNLLDQNPLPNSFSIQTDNGDVTAAVAERITQIQGVEEISYGGDLLKKIQEFATFVRTAGLAISGILGAASLAVIMNTIRLAVMARRREIEIMHLVGASNSFIAWPFLIEGMLFGLFGSMLTAAALFAWRSFTFGKWQALLPFVPMRLDYLETTQVLACLTAIGMLWGTIGSALSVRRHIRHAMSE